MKPDPASMPIAEEFVIKKFKFKPKEPDRFEGYKDRTDDEDWVPEPPKY